jgi:integrase
LELVGLELSDLQTRQKHWANVDLIGKGGHIRTVPIPQWAKQALGEWTAAAGITEGRVFRRVSRTGRVWGERISQNVVWYVVKTCCEKAALRCIAPHDLRRTSRNSAIQVVASWNFWSVMHPCRPPSDTWAANRILGSL